MARGHSGYVDAYNERRRLEYAEQQREARQRTCSECGEGFTGRPNRCTCSPECRRRRKATHGHALAEGVTVTPRRLPQPYVSGATMSVSPSSHAAMRPSATFWDSSVEMSMARTVPPSAYAILLPSGDILGVSISVFAFARVRKPSVVEITRLEPEKVSIFGRTNA